MNLSWIVDDCLARLASGESLDACLARYPEHARELAPLLGTAAQLRDLAEPRLTQGQRLAAKVALREALAEQRRPRAPVMWRWVRALPVAMILAAVLFVGVTSAAIAGSQPGDLAYPLRVVVERAPILMRFSTAGRATEEVDIAARRLSDVRDYLVRGGAVHPAALNEMLARDEAAMRRAARLTPEERQIILGAIAAHADQLNTLVGLTDDAGAQASLQAAADRILAVSEHLVVSPVVDGEPKSVVVTPTATRKSEEPIVAASPTKTRTATATPSVGVLPSATSTPRPTRAWIATPAVVVTRPARPTIVKPATVLPTRIVPSWTPVVPRITPPVRLTMTATVIVPRPTRDRDTATPRPTRPGIRRTPTFVIPTVKVPTVVIPTITVPTVVVPTVQVPTIVRPTRIVTRPAPATAAPTATSGVSGVATPTPTERRPDRTVVVPTVAVPTAVIPTMIVPATVTLPPAVQTLIVMTLVPPPAVQTVIVMTLLPPTVSALTVSAPTSSAPTAEAPAITHTPGAVQTLIATVRPAETSTPRPRGRP